MMDYRRAAQLAPLLSAMYGPKETVGQYKLGQVMLELKADIDATRLSSKTQHEYSKIMEIKAKARRRGR